MFSVLLIALATTLVSLPPPAHPAQDSREEAKQSKRWTGGMGVFYREHDEESFRFLRWTGESSVNRAIRMLGEAGGGELRFAPGTYTVEQAFRISSVPDLTISGGPGVVLEYADGPEIAPRTTKAVREGDTVIQVDRPDLVRAGFRYQLYSPERRSSRSLEIKVKSVEGNLLHLVKPVTYMPNITSIPPGSDVFEELNIFRVIASPRLVFQDLVMDGKNRGSVRGHTIYGGVYASGDYTPGELPVTYGLTIRGCTFRGFMGRAICVYGAGGVVIENNGIYDTFAQAIELDHFSQGRVIGNTIENAEVGVMLNDCFDSLVESNRITGCMMGVHLLRIFPQVEVNTGNVVRGNVIGPGCDVGVSIVDRLDVGLHGNAILGNHFIGLGPDDPVLDPFGNDVRGNTVEP